MADGKLKDFHLHVNAFREAEPPYPERALVKVSLDIGGDVRLATLDLTKPIDDVIRELREERNLEHHHERYALQLMTSPRKAAALKAPPKAPRKAAGAKGGASRRAAVFITPEKRHLVQHGAALRMVHSPAVQVAYLVQHLPASTTKLERLASDSTGASAIASNPSALQALLALTSESSVRTAASAWRVLTAVAASASASPGAPQALPPPYAIGRAMRLLRYLPAPTPDTTRLIDAVLSLFIVSGSAARISADHDAGLPITAITRWLHLSDNHHVQRKALILATEAARQEAASAHARSESPCDGPLYRALTDDRVRSDVHAIAKRECSKRTTTENTAMRALCNYQHLLLLPLAAPMATWKADQGCSQLAAGCMAHLSIRSPGAFEQASLHDAKMGLSTPEIAEALVKLLWRVLRDQDTVCVPLLGSRGVLAFYELFERAFALVYRTRREMRARVPQDQAQVERVVERQIRSALLARPSDWMRLDARLSAMPASAVTLLVHGEHLAERDRRLERHPAIAELRARRAPAIMDLVRKQRIAALREPTPFKRPVASADLRRWDHMHVRVVTTNGVNGDRRNQGDKLSSAVLEIRPSPAWLQPSGQLPLTAVSALRSGKAPRTTGASRWSRSTSQAAPLCISLQLKSPPAPTNCPPSLDLVAPDQQTLQAWLDGLAFLLAGDKEVGAGLGLGDDNVYSDVYAETLSESVRADHLELLEMDVVLQLLDTDGVPLPEEPPPVPPPPPDFNFALP